MKLSLRIAGLLVAGVCLLVTSARAEEHTSPLTTATGSTTLSGYVNTSVYWNPGGTSLYPVVLDPSLPIYVQRQQQFLNAIRQQFLLYCFSHHLNPYQFSFWNFLWLPPKSIGPVQGQPFPPPLPQPGLIITNVPPPVRVTNPPPPIVVSPYVPPPPAPGPILITPPPVLPTPGTSSGGASSSSTVIVRAGGGVNYSGAILSSSGMVGTGLSPNIIRINGQLPPPTTALPSLRSR